MGHHRAPLADRSPQENRLRNWCRLFGPPYALKFEVSQAQAGKSGPGIPRPLESADLQQQALEIFGGGCPTPDKEESE